MANKYRLLIIVSVLIVIVDQVTKWYIDSTMELYESISVIGGFFNITYIRNPGAAFGFLAGAHPFIRTSLLVVLSLLAVVLILYFVGKTKKKAPLLILSLSLILGGAVGNLIDRIRFGEVIDFLDVYVSAYHWPAFNVADSAISIGAVMLLVEMFVQERD